MSGAEFRSFQEKRPDHERWELIGGLPVMMTPPFMEHNRIASNLENLLNAALREHDATRMAVQRPGIECEWPDAVVTQLGKRGDYRPEPDVAVVSYDDVVAGKRFTAAGESGAYLRVLADGTVGAGDTIEVTYRPDHGITMSEVFRAITTERALLPKLLEAPQLPAKLIERAAEYVAAQTRLLADQ